VSTITGARNIIGKVHKTDDIQDVLTPTEATLNIPSIG
jgi:hypothetical protein